MDPDPFAPRKLDPASESDPASELDGPPAEGRRPLSNGELSAHDEAAEILAAELVQDFDTPNGSDPGPPLRAFRRWWLMPWVLFGLTFLSTNYVWWYYHGWLWSFETGAPETWATGLTYSLALLGMLFAHEMGHFLQAERYRVPVSYPYFIPMPLLPIGTMGAFIMMQSTRLNRRELFDIGLTGPLAGLAVALPLTCWGIAVTEPLPLTIEPYFGSIWLWDALVFLIHGPLPTGMHVPFHPLSMAGLITFFVTGLNMLPISQLDGGHVAHALLGKDARWLGRGLMVLALIYMVFFGRSEFALMWVLMFFLGIDHPPTADDRAPLGTFRTWLGWISLTLPVWCFTSMPINVKWMGGS